MRTYLTEKHGFDVIPMRRHSAFMIRPAPVSDYALFLNRNERERTGISNFSTGKWKTAFPEHAKQGDSTQKKKWSRLSDSNRGPTVYKTVALPLS